MQEKRRETDAKCGAMLKEAIEARKKMADDANARCKAAEDAAATILGVMQKILDEQAAAAIKITAWLRKYLARRATTAVVANS